MRKMKDSGVEWIGEIPEDWEITTYRRLLNRRKEYDDQDKQVLSLTIQGVKVKNENYGKMAEDFTGHQIVKQGDLVFTPRDFDATPILSGIAPCDGCISNLYFVLYPHNISETFIPFINYFMWGVKWGGDIWKRLSYGMRFSYNFQQFGALPIAVPPIDTQRRIADFLDDKCGKIDRYIEKQQQIIDKLKEYKQAVITETVTKGLDPDVPMKDSGIEWIGMIPEHWENRKVISILAMRVVDGSHESPELFDEGIPYISATAIVNGKIDFSQKRGFISPEYCDICDQRYVPQLDDILMIKLGASTGQVAMVETTDRFNIWVPLAAIRCNESACPKFVYYAFQSDYFIKQMQLSWTYGTQQTLGVKTIERLRILMPLVEEQKQIADYLTERRKLIDTSIEKYQQIVDKLTEYKKSLIYEAVTGKLEV